MREKNKRFRDKAIQHLNKLNCGKAITLVRLIMSFLFYINGGEICVKLLMKKLKH